MWFARQFSSVVYSPRSPRLVPGKQLCLLHSWAAGTSTLLLTEAVPALPGGSNYKDALGTSHQTLPNLPVPPCPPLPVLAKAGALLGASFPPTRGKL